MNKPYIFLGIDDNADNLVVLQALLSEAFPGSEFIKAYTGEEGLKAARSHLPHVILLDIVMPGMDGYEVCTTIKKDGVLGNIPVVFITAARTDKDNRIKALRAGADGFLSKPVDTAELKAQVVAMLRIREAEELKRSEKSRLEAQVNQRTSELETELKERKKIEDELRSSLEKLAQSKLAALNLMEDLKSEIRERETAEQEIRNNETRLKSIVRVLQHKEADSQDFLDLALHEALLISGSKIGYIYFYDEEKKQFILNTWSKEVMKECSVTNPQTCYELDKTGIWGEAVRQLKPIIVNDFKAENPLKKGYPDGHVELQKFMTIPVFKGKQVVAVLGVANKESDYTDSDVLQLSLLMDAVWKTSEHKVAEDALKQSEERYRLLYENAIEGIYRSTPDGKLIAANPSFARMLGWEDSTELLRQMDNIGGKMYVNPDDRSTLIQLLESEGHAENFETELYRRDGSRFWVLINARAVRNKEGFLECIEGTNIDITSKKVAEKELIESEQKYRELANSIPVMVFETDLGGRLTFWNRTALEIFGYSDEDVTTGFTVQEALHPGDRNKFSELFNQWITSAQNHTGEYIAQRKDGSCFPMLVSSYTLMNGNKPCGIRGIAIDISERKKFEEELLTAKNRAEESDRLKTSFLQNLSHEIRTPMNAIVGFSQLMNEPGQSTSELLQYASIIMKSSNHLLSIINDIVNISRLEAGQEKIQSNSFELNSVLREIFEQFAPAAREKKLVVDLLLPADAGEINILTDETKLRQVLINLLTNAIKFTDKGRISITYELRDGDIEFRVSDTGIGIPPEKQQIIFERFRQADESISVNFGGTGLGLSISRAYAEMLGGRLWLKSQPGKGSEFYFTIPFIASKKPQRQETQKKQVNQSGSGKTILVAEDEELNFLFLSRMLSDLNFNILRASNGQEAVDRVISGEKIDLILMDIKMPVMNGFEASMRIKKSHPQIPIIAQTAYAHESDKNKAFECGCDAYIIKPIRKDVILSVIKEKLERGSRG